MACNYHSDASNQSSISISEQHYCQTVHLGSRTPGCIWTNLRHGVETDIQRFEGIDLGHPKKRAPNQSWRYRVKVGTSNIRHPYHSNANSDAQRVYACCVASGSYGCSLGLGASSLDFPFQMQPKSDATKSVQLY